VITGIVDVAHGEAGGDVAAAASHGLAALWAKVSQGKDWLDPSYARFRDAARAAGILFGDYHFASGSSPGAQQAEWFLAHADPAALHALDWEHNPDTRDGDMTLADAEAFVTHVFARTGRWPVLYSGASFLRERAIPSSSVLGHCPLWIAQYGERPMHIPSPWSAFDLWQYTDVADGPTDRVMYPRHTPGLGVKVDRSCFRGSFDELCTWWSTAGRTVTSP
jgi:lysozyme